MIFLSSDEVAMQKPAGLVAGGLGGSDLSGLIDSGHGSPPAWRSHDDGGDRDGGGSASV